MEEALTEDWIWFAASLFDRYCNTSLYQFVCKRLINPIKTLSHASFDRFVLSLILLVTSFFVSFFFLFLYHRVWTGCEVSNYRFIREMQMWSQAVSPLLKINLIGWFYERADWIFNNHIQRQSVLKAGFHLEKKPISDTQTPLISLLCLKDPREHGESDRDSPKRSLQLN